MVYGPRRSFLREWLAIGIPVGSLFNIPIRVHLLLLLALLYNWAFYVDLNAPLSWRIGLWLFSFAALFGSVLLHELGHCFGSYRVGGTAEQIILWPMGGLAYTSGVEKGPKEELVVTVLGPTVSLALAAAFSAIGYALKYFGANAPLWLTIGVQHLAFLNWMLFAFNILLPLFPMDSARILRGLASLRFNPNQTTFVITTIGIWLGAVLALLSFARLFPDLVGPWLGLIGLLGAISSYQERKRLEFQDVYADGPWYWRDRQYEAPTHVKKSVLAEVREAFTTLKSAGPGVSSPPEMPKHTPDERDLLKKELADATEHEDFLRAAQLRDQIRNLANQSNNPKLK